ncbi:MAG: acyl-CoA thioesterase [Deltaproteobacteria bacterium]|nr:acyl-CoA thioesterase [Deltaproteobacteria bacterium]
MRPRAMQCEPLADRPNLVRDQETGLVWHRSGLRVLYVDTDRSGAVYHANYLRYFEAGRAAFMRDAGFPYAEVERRGYLYPVVQTGLNFYEYLEYDEPVWVHTRPALLERVRVRIDYALTREGDGRIVCDGFTLHCALNGTRRPVAVDEETQRTWREFPS